MEKHPHDPEGCVINLDDRIEAIAHLDNKGHHNATTAVFCVARDY